MKKFLKISFWDSTKDVCVRANHIVVEHEETFLIKDNSKFHQKILNIFQIESVTDGKELKL